MQIGKFTIALLAMLAVACVPPESKGPKKQFVPAGVDDVPEMPDDRLNNASNNTANNGATNNTIIVLDDVNAIAGPSCGDGLVEGDEECDGDAAVSCEDLDFDGGYTSCSANCIVNTTACTRVTCGDGVVQDDETCDDGADNGAYDTCNTNCSGLAEYCGDGAVNGPEACDGSPRGATCQSLGFDGGTMKCGTGCQLDTSSCSSCGDGIVGEGEVCDAGALNGTYGNCNALCTGLGATCGDGVRNGPESCDGAQLGGATCATLGAGRGAVTCTTSCGYNVNACSMAPAVGEVIITEIMQNPAQSLDNDGEYFELYNTTTAALDLDGCVIESGTASGPETVDINRTLFVPAKGYIVLARSANAPFTPDHVYGTGLNLNNSVDELALKCPQPNGSLPDIDRVSYDDGATFPDPEGASMSLNPNRLTASQNDIGSNWCQATSVFGVGDRGTPGAPNDSCN